MESERPLLADLQQQATGLAGDLREMLQLRWQLARMELESDVATAKRLAIGVSAATVMGLTALPLLVTSGAELLERFSGISRTVWLAGIGAALLLAAIGLGWTACRRFRRNVVALNETLEELREDLVWLQEWSKRKE